MTREDPASQQKRRVKTTRRFVLALASHAALETSISRRSALASSIRFTNLPLS
ncbi:hypothetical protein ACVIF9_004623 [Bradyrhizobium sp. USDA 4350]|uniref:Uncharacterized protein n=1 Tax=Bradyrhizobium erythrophlei TaxID=1437360 RepID=A0A1H5FBW2_9BRAD|nr:hypothetical protein SAMN05444164_6592 [Bradyrhizobium erythrophlei]